MKKKLKSSLGDVIVPNEHAVGQMANNFRMTSYLQEQVSYVGQKETFEEGSETLKRLTGIEVSNMQIQRVSEHYGQCIEEATEELLKEDSLPKQAQVDSSKITYGMTDGSMVLTKEDGWKEIKLGRVFNADENVPVTEERHWIKESKYCAYLGGFEQFLERFELLLLNNIGLLVFIADGAKWFWDWVSVFYPKAIQILDYYHCKEYLCEYARLIFTDDGQKAKWIKMQEKFLFKDQVEKVIANIKLFIGLTGDALNYQQKIITYYENNKTRMLYGTYKKKGLLIGSGPIESAHRNVIQKRLKLSGQRWSQAGVQKIANLRVAHKSNEWNKVVEMIQSVKKAA
jgi:hypothetical protein